MACCLPHFLFRKRKHQASPSPLNILLSNGRFPVALDLARQLHSAGHNVFVVDPMEYHVCKFSQAVKQSYYSPAPSVDTQGYIKTVKEAVQKSEIDLIIPLHEEIFHLASCGDKEILDRLFAPKFDILYRLHNKWTFSALMLELGFDVPEAHLCRSSDDVRALDRSKEWAVKPILGRGSTGVHHLHKDRKDEDLPDINVSDEIPHIAQEWIRGKRYCTYGVFREGKMQALGIYPVLETLDGSSSVYFQALEHNGIRDYVRRIAETLKITGQLAFDFVETEFERQDKSNDEETDLAGDRRSSGDITVVQGDARSSFTTKSQRRLITIECNPRATSGIHLWSRSPLLARVLTSGIRSPYVPAPNAIDYTQPSIPFKVLIAEPGSGRQLGPGMLMWEHKNANFKRYIEHMKRLIWAHDVVFSWRDICPVLVQPFLLTSYYEICRERGGISLADMYVPHLLTPLILLPPFNLSVKSR
ncbi:hypothetical protein IFR04_001485 [Cadophora malorum]|uniref:ATP-grasp domain-containing protein n=1 Tax=Cadophora malorum TaxID=108018 RepID=A0A8H7WI91_9HELO|nr:hypothetical protein IFR04_001485 [Cadophora malorum]